MRGSEEWLKDPDDGWNYVRTWMHSVGIEEANMDPVWAVGAPLLRHLSDEQIAEIIGADRLDAFWERVREEARALSERIERRQRAIALLPSRA